MKSIILKTFIIFLILSQSYSCTHDPIGNFEEIDSDIEIREKSQKEAPSYSLLYQKEIFEFDSKRALYSFLAKKDDSKAIFLAEVIVSDLNKEYIKNYGEDYIDDQKIWKNFEKDLEEEFETDELSSSYQCVICTIFPDQCIDDMVTNWFVFDYFNLRVYNEAQYMGENYLFDNSKIVFMTEYNSCTGLFGTIEIPSLTTRGIFWNNKISSFKLNTQLGHTTAILILHSESGLTGSEFVYPMSENDSKVWESDLSDIYWTRRNLPLSADNDVSSIELKFHREN